MRVSAGSSNFIVDRNLLLTADGREVVRCFGRQREVVVPANVEILGKSCFESCEHLAQVLFDAASKLRRMSCSAFSKCGSLASIAIPASVENIEDEAFNECNAMDYCLMDEDASLIKIGNAAFAECLSLRFLGITRLVESIGQDCFRKGLPLSGLGFDSGDSLKKVVDQMGLDVALKTFGINEVSTVFSIEVAQGGEGFEFPGWSSFTSADSRLRLVKAM
jgi:hypothetical protein